MSARPPLAPVACVALSRAIATLPGLSALLGVPVLRPGQDLPGLTAILAWGRKPSAGKAERYAAARGLPLLRVEDGFLRSVDIGAKDPPLSLVQDDLGIYYDASQPSRLEELIRRPLLPAEAARAQRLMHAWRAGGVSKYNHAPEAPPGLPERFVLVVDQTAGDASIAFGQADARSFSRMLEAALAEHPDSRILLKVHPEVFAGRKRAHFDVFALARNPRILVLGEDVHPADLLARAEAVYTVTSQMGFEGLLWGKPVRTFGMPFYAGWGLTTDELPPPGRRQPMPLEHLVHAALVDYPRYVDPETGLRCEVETVLAHLALQRHMRRRFPPHIHAAGFSRWKRPIVRSFFQGSQVKLVRKAEHAPAGATLAVWGRRAVPAHHEQESRLIRLEDGFLRSVGLGADLVRPLSWVMDSRGIYYDATRPSDLEHLLQHAEFDACLLERARALRQDIVTHGLTKYNVGSRPWQRPGTNERVILVPGQVESDASIRYGAPGIRTNLGLLQAVRAANPDAFVLYKPHPDVLAGLRREGQAEDTASRWCNEIVTDAAMGELLTEVDEVHVLTSLAGFEALMRGKPVTAYGQPFYSGWGLTRDPHPVPRRTRRLTLDELIAGVLILYPAYVSRVSGRFTTPERALTELLAWRQQGPTPLPLWRRLWRAARNLGYLGA